ncbi:sulfite oxidase [Nocardioides sp. MAHUQ-72]|uniref:sulfite oxidase n=1 Tax=unclassified Nocardioides TaxID=2615069 RepID=UPI00362315DD
MAPSLEEISAASRVAERGEGIGADELHLASRNHALPLEALRLDVTPPGLHYVLTHYDIPHVDPATWQLTLDGLVDRPLGLDLATLVSLPRHTVRATLECAGNGRAALEPRPVSQPWLNGAVGTADWTGVRLRDLLDRAGVSADAVDVVFTGLDHGIERGVEQDYQRGLSLAEARRDDVLVAYEMNGGPLPPQHGFPARLVVPGWYGMASVKWLASVTVSGEEFDGYQHHAYRVKQHVDDPGVPVTWIEPRALLVPPGFPDFMTRARVVRPGRVVLEGRAWSGWGPVERVEVSTDDGVTWSEVSMGPDAGRWAWRGFTATWDAVPGEHALRVRAYDATGRAQGTEPVWNRGGFTNNADQPVPCLVLDE